MFVLLVLLVLLGAPAAAAAAPPSATPIDRQALVARHRPVLRQIVPESPLSVGNGALAFTADVTGLQTFPDAYAETFPLATQSEWGWHRAPNPGGWDIDRFRFEEFESHGRKVGYADIPGDRRTAEIEWLRNNPHRLNLGRIGFRLRLRDGRLALKDDLRDIEQSLDLWTGLLSSRFTLDGVPVEVRTVCHPQRDAIAVHVVSPLVASGAVAVELAFPYGTAATSASDWTQPDAHRTTVTRAGAGRADVLRTLDEDPYHVGLRWGRGAALTQEGPHTLLIRGRGKTLEVVAAFAPRPPAAPPDFAATLAASRAHWRRFWTTGGAIDLSASRDPRWRELERRIVLSQYLTAIQSAGRFPPPETGLSYNSWGGKFHLEMHWWHAVHFALWGRAPLLEKSLGYYASILPRAQATARRQGYAGARWPKMTDPSGAESPSTIGPFLVWQQPHPIYYAEIAYREHRDRATLDRFREVVSETAAFMASFAAGDAATGRTVLGPPLQCAQEVFPRERTVNCSFELAYWRWGLETAQRWRERLGQPRDPGWDHVLRTLPLPAVSQGKYLFAESAPESYTDPVWARDHPMVLGALGMLPGEGLDRDTMRRTLDWIWEHWRWRDTWGWDYPMVAMSAARLGEPKRAVDALLMDTPKNTYVASGHNTQRPGLTLYLPGNGGLLAAAAMMAAGWDGAPDRHAPGFPADGSWTVRWEALRRMP